jgi:hypothetical protein
MTKACLPTNRLSRAKVDEERDKIVAISTNCFPSDNSPEKDDENEEEDDGRRYQVVPKLASNVHQAT